MEDVWFEWTGGDCPVSDGSALVDVKFRYGGECYETFAEDWEWRHEKDSYDIVAYRLSKVEGE
jgi:hypothetical protein